MKKINFAIFGCGFIASVHAAAIRSIPEAYLVGATDVRDEAAESFAEKYEIKKYDGLKELLEDENIDVISVCTPNGTHADLAIQILKANKNVVLEKPMALSVADCDRIEEAVKQSKGRVMVISQLRSSPDIVRAREIVKSGVLGKLILCDLYMKYHRSPEYYRGSWKGTLAMDGGALMNQGVHGIDLIQHIVGPIKHVKSIVKTLYHDIEGEDTAVSVVEYENGALGIIEATTAINPGFDREIRIHGTNGSMELRENCIERLCINGKEEPCSTYESLGANSDPTKLNFEEHANQFKALVRLLNGDDVEIVDEHQGRKAVEIIEKIYVDRESEFKSANKKVGVNK